MNEYISPFLTLIAQSNGDGANSISAQFPTDFNQLSFAPRLEKFVRQIHFPKRK